MKKDHKEAINLEDVRNCLQDICDDDYGIHVMASQNQSGDIITGDSHDYDEPNDPFNNEEIDSLILLKKEGIFSFVQQWPSFMSKPISSKNA